MKEIVVGLRHKSATFLVLAVLFPGGAALATTRASSVKLFAGVARDTLGHLISDVEVLVLADFPRFTPLATAKTDSAGRFIVPDLPAGLYRIAAVKDGYLTYLGQINTYLRTSAELVLHPSPRSDDPAGSLVQEDLSWVLRLPKRGLLRDTDGGGMLPSDGSGGSRVVGPAFYDTLQGQVTHLVALGAIGSSSPAESTDMQGTETRLRLSSALGRQGNIRLQGRRESIDRVTARDFGSSLDSREAAALKVDMAYDSSREGMLAVNAFYSQNTIDAGIEDAPSSVRDAQRYWGYDATWSKQLDPASRLALQVDYLDTSANMLPSSLEPSNPALRRDSRRGFSNRSIGAQGSFESVAGDRHQLRFDLRAQFLDLSGPLVAAAGETPIENTGGEERWSVQLRAEDAWALSGPITFLYGMGIEQSLAGREGSLVVPKVGGLWSSGGLRLGFALAYHALVANGEASQVGTYVEPFRPAQRVGYDAEVETPLPWGFRLKGAYEYSPLQYGVERNPDQSPDFFIEQLVYLTDGNTAVRQGSLGLERHSGCATAFLRVTAGTAEGTFAQLPTIDLPVLVLDERQIRTRSGLLGVRVSSTGTDVTAEYREINGLRQSRMTDGVSSEFPYEYIELRVAQHLLRLQASGMSLQLLFAARTSPGSHRTREATDQRTGTLSALYERVSAGLSMTF